MHKGNLSDLPDHFLVFAIDRNFFAIPVKMVKRIIPSIIITRVPGFQEHILGVVNVLGEAVPVFNIRKIFKLPAKDTELTDLFILLTVSGQTISFAADSVQGIMNRTDRKMIPAGEVAPGLEKILEGLIFLDDGMILIYDPGKLFVYDNMIKIDIKKLGQTMRGLQESGKKRAARAKKPAGRKTSKPLTDKPTGPVKKN